MTVSPQTSNQRQFSREGFKQIPNEQQYNMNGMNDVTIDIPLEHVPSAGAGLRSKNSVLQPSQSRTSAAEEHRPLFRGRRHKVKATTAGNGNIGYDGEVDTITTMGRIYKRILNFSVVTRYFVYVLPVALIIAIPIIIGRTTSTQAQIGGVPIEWFFFWIEIVWLSLWISKVVAHYLPLVFQFLVGVVNSGIRKYAMVLRSLEIPLSLVGWAVASLATFMPIMTVIPEPHPEVQDWMYIVQEILAASLVSSLIFLAEKTIVQLISINYHRKQFNSRIKESKRHVVLLSLLHEASIKLFPAYCNEFAEEDYAIVDELNLAKRLGGKRHSRHISGVRTPLRMIQDVGRYGDKLTSAFGNIAHEVTGKEVFNPSSSHSIVVEALERKRTSEALAKRIWMSFAVEGHEALTQEDLTEVLGPGLENEAIEAFSALDRDGNADISLDEMIMTVIDFSRERKAIANSMHDVDQAINVLDKLLITVVLVATVFIFVGFLNKNFTTTLATTGTALLSLSFVFAATCQEVLGSCIFLFVKHPYDIGDRVDISTNQYVVEHISLLFTVFRRVSGTGIGRLVQIPNITLNTLYIENVTRSKLMAEQISIFVSFDTSFADIQTLQSEMVKFVTDKENSRDFQPDVDIQVLGTTDMSKLELQVEIRHKSNWSNETLRAARRSKFMCALVAALRVVPIYAPGGGSEAQGSVGNPSYSVAISDAEARGNVKAAADAKEAKRMFPLTKVDSNTSATRAENEMSTIQTLNARNPAVDTARDEAWTSSRDDSSTLGRPSVDEEGLEEVRGLLRRESTRGKRKAGMEAGLAVPSVSTIIEPPSNAYPPTIGQMPYLNPPPPAASTAYQPHQQPLSSIGAQYSGVMAGSASSSAQRNRSESAARKPIPAPPPIPDDEEEHFKNTRPYSGV